MNKDERYYQVIEAIQNAKRNIIQAWLADDKLKEVLDPLCDELLRLENGYKEEFTKQLRSRK